MSINSLLAFNSFSTMTPKLTVVQKKFDVVALLKKNGMLGSVEKADTVEISDASKKAYAPRKLDTSVLPPELKELVEWVSDRNQAFRPRAPQPDPFEATRPKPDPRIEEEKYRQTKMMAKQYALTAKMRAGCKPSAADISFMRTHCPGLYEIAKRAERESEQFRVQLRNCKTKEEKDRMVMLKKNMLGVEALNYVKATKQEPLFYYIIMAAIDKELDAYERQPQSCKVRDARERMMDEMVDEVPEVPEVYELPEVPEVDEQSARPGSAENEGAQVGEGREGNKNQMGSAGKNPIGGEATSAERRKRGGKVGAAGSPDVRIEAYFPAAFRAAGPQTGGLSNGTVAATV
jgi:hypothetical protein